MALPGLTDHPDTFPESAVGEQPDALDICECGEEADRCSNAFRSWSLQVACRCMDLW